MLSISQFRRNLFPVFAVMRTTGSVFEVTYKGKVYDVSVRETTKKPVYTRAKKDRAVPKILPHRIDMQECEKCGTLMVAGMCMNTKCAQATLSA